MMSPEEREVAFLEAKVEKLKAFLTRNGDHGDGCLIWVHGDCSCEYKKLIDDPDCGLDRSKF